MRHVRCLAALGLLLALFGPVVEVLAQAQPTGDLLTRLIFQDDNTRTLRWADVRIAGENLTLGSVATVTGFPKLDPKKQTLVQMVESNGLVLVGVRDQDNGQFRSGWVLLHSGVGYTDHGDHAHWNYTKKPQVWDSRIDDKQGNPAHLYVYEGKFFVANDLLNGYTRIDPSKYATAAGRRLGKDQPRFLVGGGNHITLAVVEDKVGYSCWIDGGGPNAGRVDVTPITSSERSEPAYSFHLPTGVIHGATACNGKVFFAPADGICWVDADRELTTKADAVKIHHISLGKQDDKPRRTGAFTTHGKHVLCVTGKGPGSQLVLLDTRQKELTAQLVPLSVKQGTLALTPTVAVTPAGKTYALICHDVVKGADATDALEIVDLDPDGDGQFTDARSVKTLTIGRSAVEGHFGHHGLALDADRRYAFVTNPGDGTIEVVSLKTLERVATWNVGGKPTALIARGGQEVRD
jgi:DNA-binding beta-propeller fold protein YncE